MLHHDLRLAHPSKHTILLLAASPDDLDRLALEAERVAIDRELQSSAQRDDFEIRIAEQVEAEQLPGLIMRHDPAILQFSGHGAEHGQLMFHRRDGSSQATDVDAVATVFRLLGGNIRCVLLNACYTAPLAERIAEHVDVVVGMRQALDDRSAIAFSAGFYEALGYGKSFADAFELGKLRIGLASLPDEDQPKLHIRKGCEPANLRLSPPAHPKVDGEPNPHLVTEHHEARVRLVWGAVIAASFVVVAAVGWTKWKAPDAPDESDAKHTIPSSGESVPNLPSDPEVPLKSESKVDPEPAQPDTTQKTSRRLDPVPSAPPDTLEEAAQPDTETPPDPPPKRWKVDRIEDVSPDDQKHIVLVDANDLPSTGVLVLVANPKVQCSIKRDLPRWCSLVTRPGAPRPKPGDEFELRP